MFEKSFLDLLKADPALVGLVSDWEINEAEFLPALFADSVPQTAEYPYVVFDIRKASDANLAMSSFVVDIDIYDDSGSGVKSRDIAERIEFITDTKKIIGDDRFNTIRLYYENGGPVENSDIKVRHYNLQVSARGGRKKWIDETIA